MSNTTTEEDTDDTTSNHDKDYKICDVLGGLDVTRLVSTNARNFFSSAIDDVELMREYLTEAASSGGGNWTSDFATLEDMARTLDWQARGLPEGTTSVEAGIGYSDDRPDRRIDRYAGTFRMPLVGDRESDFAMMDALVELRGVTVARFDIPEPATREGILAAYAAAFDANPRTRLLLLTDVAGVLDKQKNLLREIKVKDIPGLIADGTAAGGMIPKLETAAHSVIHGVGAAVILDGRAPHALLMELFTEHGAGTLVS